MILKPDKNCPTCWKKAIKHRKDDDDSDVILECYISTNTPRGCSVSHAMHPDLDIWLQLHAMVGWETPISQAHQFLKDAGATEEDLDIILYMRSWAAEARKELQPTTDQQRPPR